TKLKHSKTTTRSLWPKLTVKPAPPSKPQPTKQQNSTPPETNSTARASPRLGRISNTSCRNYKPKNTAPVTLASSPVLKLNTRPAPSGKNWKPATACLCPARTKHVLNTHTKTTTRNGPIP